MLNIINMSSNEEFFLELKDLFDEIMDGLYEIKKRKFFHEESFTYQKKKYYSKVKIFHLTIFIQVFITIKYAQKKFQIMHF